MPTSATRYSEPIPDPAHRTVEILIVDDSRTNRHILRALLLKLGHHADLATNGFEAVAATRTRQYDLILMDIVMPGLDGIGAALEIRRIAGKPGRVPIVAVTADTLAEQHIAESGVAITAIMMKPISIEALASLLAQLGLSAVRTG